MPPSGKRAARSQIEFSDTAEHDGFRPGNGGLDLRPEPKKLPLAEIAKTAEKGFNSASISAQLCDLCERRSPCELSKEKQDSTGLFEKVALSSNSVLHDNIASVTMHIIRY